jgi:NADH dehydrogenase FAD-containing subunit
MNTTETRIVVVGSGVAGTIATIGLMRKVHKRNKIHITLVDKKEYFEYHGTWTLRTLVNSQFFGATHIDKFNAKGLKKNNHELTVLGGHKMVALDTAQQTITVEDAKSQAQQILPYHHLILATGASYTDMPAIKPSWEDRTLAARNQTFKTFSEQIKHAKHILIVGGGSVGVEMLGEISDTYPNKRITLVHSKDRLLERATADANKYVQNWVEAQNKLRGEKEKITIILNDSVLKSKTSETVKGQAIEDVGLVLYTTGPRPNTEGFDTMGIALDVQVDKYLRVNGHSNIYALGDINNTKEEKSAASARMQAKWLSATLKLIIANDKLKSPKTLELKPYENQKFAQLISLGTKKGIVINSEKILMAGKFPTTMKSYMEKNVLVGLITKPDGFMNKALY